MAIVALPKGENRIVAVARLEVDSERKRGEFALEVADAWQGLGLGAELLNYLIVIACDYELDEIHCFVSSDNTRMIRLAQKAGLKVKLSERDTLELSLMLYGFDNTPIA